MKNVRLLLLWMLLVAVVFVAACSSTASTGGGSSGGKVTITYWNLFGGGDGMIMEKLVKQFNEEHKDTIEVKALTQDWGQFYTKLQTAVAGNTSPDLAVSHTSKLSELIDLGILEPLDAHADAAGVDWSAFNQNMLDATMFDGKHYAMPLDAHPLILYYNKKILGDLGLLDGDGKPAIDPGPDGFVAFLTKIKAGAPQGTMNLGLASGGEDPYRVWWALYNQLGGPGILDESGAKVNVSNEQGKQAAEYISGLFSSGLVPVNQEKIGENFQAGKTALLPTGVWFTGTLEATEGLEFGAVPFPQIFDKPATWIDSHTFVIPKHKKMTDDKVKASLTFAKWVTDHAAMWSEAGHIPATTTAIESEEFKSLPLRQDYLQAGNDGVYLPNSPKLWPIKDQLVQALGGVWAGTYDVDKGLTEATANMEKILNR